MTHRERVQMALRHETPDRCPMQISFTPEFADRLRQDMKKGNKAKHNPHGGGNSYELEIALDQEVLITSVGWANSYYQSLKPNTYYTDEWNVRGKVNPYQTPFGQGVYTEMVGFPLADEQAITSYKPPDPNRPELYADAATVLENYQNEYWIVGAVVTTIFETAWALRGLDTLLMDFYTNPDLAEAILDIPYRYHLTVAKKLTEMRVDMIWLGDDVGGQTQMMISPELWRQFLKPRMAALIAALRDINPNIKIAYHSDGNIYDIIPELIEIGIDVLNPLQPASLNVEQIKKEFGNRLCFWGSIDEQHTLPFGSPQDVKKQVKQRISTLGHNGGLIIGPTHHVQLDTPLENFWAMVDTIKEPIGQA